MDILHYLTIGIALLAVGLVCFSFPAMFVCCTHYVYSCILRRSLRPHPKDLKGYSIVFISWVISIILFVVLIVLDEYGIIGS